MLSHCKTGIIGKEQHIVTGIVISLLKVLIIMYTDGISYDFISKSCFGNQDP